MKKLLVVLGAIGLSATIGTQVVACQKKDQRLDLKTCNNDLGDFENQPDAQMILARFNEKNDLGVVLDQDVTIEKVVETKALVKAEPQSTLVTGTLEVFFEIPSLKTQPTRYIDKDGNEQSTDEKILDNLNPKIEEITQIGFYEKSDGVIQVVQMPKSVEKVPNKLPRQITSLSGMFYGAEKFNQDISSWDVTSVNDMSFMFLGADHFNQNIADWNVSNVTDMRYMFSGAKSFNQDISSWDVSNVTSMRSMFEGAEKFSQDLSKWNVAKVKSWKLFASRSGFAKELQKWPPKFRN